LRERETQNAIAPGARRRLMTGIALWLWIILAPLAYILAMSAKR
jgi:hypothetical protein